MSIKKKKSENSAQKPLIKKEREGGGGGTKIRRQKDRRDTGRSHLGVLWSTRRGANIRNNRQHYAHKIRRTSEATAGWQHRRVCEERKRKKKKKKGSQT